MKQTNRFAITDKHTHTKTHQNTKQTSIVIDEIYFFFFTDLKILKTKFSNYSDDEPRMFDWMIKAQ